MAKFQNGQYLPIKNESGLIHEVERLIRVKIYFSVKFSVNNDEKFYTDRELKQIIHEHKNINIKPCINMDFFENPSDVANFNDIVTEVYDDQMEFTNIVRSTVQLLNNIVEKGYKIVSPTNTSIYDDVKSIILKNPIKNDNSIEIIVKELNGVIKTMIDGLNFNLNQACVVISNFYIHLGMILHEYYKIHNMFIRCYIMTSKSEYPIGSILQSNTGYMYIFPEGSRGISEWSDTKEIPLSEYYKHGDNFD